MKNHAVKFLLLAAVFVAVFFSRTMYPQFWGVAGAGAGQGTGAGGRGAGTAAGASAGGTASEVPLFRMPPVAVSAAGGEGIAASAPEAAAATDSAGNGTPPPALTDAASLVMDLGTGAVAEAKNPGLRWPTASLAKLMSATIIFDKIPTSTDITITNQMFAADPDERNLIVGGRYTVEDLLHLMLMPSSNVAAQANADFYGLDAFLNEMNARAAEWGMADTHYDDPSGISAGDESTVSDLAKLAQVIYARYPGIFAISDTPAFYLTNLNTGARKLVRSINAFAGTPDFIGGKTGYTDQADQNLLTVFRYRGSPVLIIVLGSHQRFADTMALFNWFKENFK